MPTKILGKYNDNLRCLLEHEGSGQELITDAPKDNNGKGESYSPTDLLAAGLGSCMLTIIAIRARKRKIEIGQPTFRVLKTMKSSPREISLLEVEITFNLDMNDEDKNYLEHEARNCPVALSLNKDIQQEIKFVYA